MDRTTTPHGDDAAPQPTRASRPVRVALIDDDPMVLSTLHNYLSLTDRLEVVATAGDGADAVALVDAHAPDVVLMDVQMPRTNGIAATRALKQRFDAVKVVLLTTFDNDEHLLSALSAGAHGFLLKSSSPQEIISAILQAHEGNKVVSPGPTTRLIDNYLSPTEVTHRDAVALTDREEEVLGLICRGRSNRKIAQELLLGETTVKTHVSSIMRKFQVTSRLEIVVYAYGHRRMG